MILRVDAVRCPEHGNLLPEMIVTPFSIDDRLLSALPFVCGVCFQYYGVEGALICPPEVESEPIEAPLSQHWADIGHDPDANPPWYPIWEARPVARTEDGDPVYQLGVYQRPGEGEAWALERAKERAKGPVAHALP